MAFDDHSNLHHYSSSDHPSFFRSILPDHSSPDQTNKQETATWLNNNNNSSAATFNHQWLPTTSPPENQHQDNNSNWEKEKCKADILTHPLYEQLLSAHVSCLRIATPVDQLPRIDAQLAQSQQLVAKYSVLAGNGQPLDHKDLDHFMVLYVVVSLVFFLVWTFMFFYSDLGFFFLFKLGVFIHLFLNFVLNEKLSDKFLGETVRHNTN